MAGRVGAGTVAWLAAVVATALAVGTIGLWPRPATAFAFDVFHPDHYELTDGCLLNARGIGDCAPLVGGATGANDDPAPLEEEFGARFGVHRTYFRADQVDLAVTTARTDLELGRIPWISFKLPLPWAAMAAGEGDQWAIDLAARLDTLPGPVWVAFHHEPEQDDPDIAAWRATQERLGPLLRSRAPNAAFTVILTGWNQLYGPAEFSLDALWPHTTVDLAGFDIYSPYATARGGNLPASLARRYFVPIQAWASSQGVAWGLGETGLSDEAAETHPDWIQRTTAELGAQGGLVLAYFDSTLNSTESWSLDTPGKRADFAAALRAAPRLVR